MAIYPLRQLPHDVGGLTYPPLTNNIFLRAADLDGDRLIGPSGKPVPGERTLTYFVAHEIMHTLLADELGAVRYLRLPDWKNEGYADHVAKGIEFSVRALRWANFGKETARWIPRLRTLSAVQSPRRVSSRSEGTNVHELLNQEFDLASLETKCWMKPRIMSERRRPYARDRAKEEPVESTVPEKRDPVEQIKQAFQNDDADRVRALLDSHPKLKAEIDQPLGPFDSPPIVNVRSRAMLDVLLEAGADLNAKSRWWAGGFGLLDWANPEAGRICDQAGRCRGRTCGGASGDDGPTPRISLTRSRLGPRPRRRRADIAPLRQLG